MIDPDPVEVTETLDGFTVTLHSVPADARVPSGLWFALAVPMLAAGALAVAAEGVSLTSVAVALLTPGLLVPIGWVTGVLQRTATRITLSGTHLHFERLGGFGTEARVDLADLKAVRAEKGFGTHNCTLHLDTRVGPIAVWCGGHGIDDLHALADRLRTAAEHAQAAPRDSTEDPVALAALESLRGASEPTSGRKKRRGRARASE